MKSSVLLTTAISYTNGKPHIGHAYEIIVADVLKKLFQVFGRDVFLLTGTDEHGQKIERKALHVSKKPIDFCNEIVVLFQHLNRDLNIDFNNFIRTTSEIHRKTVYYFYDLVKEDVYLGEYSGYYSVREERFVPESEAKANGYVDKVSGEPLTKISEPSYFFKMDKYRLELLKHIQDTDFVLDVTHRINICNTLASGPLEDLSISRVSFGWGIPLPQKDAKDDQKHIFYVWFDALLNYLSGIDYFGLNDFNCPEFSNDALLTTTKEQTKEQIQEQNEEQKTTNQIKDQIKNQLKDQIKDQIKDPAIHIVGKDIVWFHAVIWPCMLLAAKLPLPRHIVVHGFVNDANNIKMSKSLNNVVEPSELLQTFSPETIRYYFLRAGVFGKDIKFSFANVKVMYSTELLNLYGNLVNRCFCMAQKHTEKLENKQGTSEFHETLEQSVKDMLKLFRLDAILSRLVHELQYLNKWLYEKEPWKIKDVTTKTQILEELIGKLWSISTFMYPYLPESCSRVLHWCCMDSSTLSKVTSFLLFEPLVNEVVSQKQMVVYHV